MSPREPKVRPRVPKVSPREPKGAKREAKGAKREPKGTKREPKVRPKSIKMLPKVCIREGFGDLSLSVKKSCLILVTFSMKKNDKKTMRSYTVFKYPKTGENSMQKQSPN